MTAATQLTPLRYDSPTVTLEVMAREAAVSQWSDKPVVQVLRYQLQIRSLSSDTDPVEILGDRASFLPLMQAVQHYVQAQLIGDGSRQAVNSGNAAAPYLESHGFTQHTLHLGRHRTTTGQTSLTLGAVQLADLEQVLDQLDTAVRPLPVSLVSAQQRRPWRQWGAAAAGIVAAVGVTTVLWPQYQSQQSLETAQEAPTADQQVDPMPSQENIEERSPQADTAPEVNAEAEAPTASEDAASQAGTPPPSDRPETPANPGTQNEVATAPAAPSRSRETAPQPDSSSPPPPPASSGAEPPATAEETTPKTPSTPREPRPAAQPNPAARSPQAPPEPTAADESASGAAAESSADAAAAPESFSTEALQNATPAPGSLADLVQQVRDRWQPPAALDQTLTYTLVFAADGTLVEVMPMNDLAAEYRDRTGIPAVGTEWRPSGSPQRGLLLLKPDGSVEFREAVDE